MKKQDLLMMPGDISGNLKRVFFLIPLKRHQQSVAFLLITIINWILKA